LLHLYPVFAADREMLS